MHSLKSGYLEPVKRELEEFCREIVRSYIWVCDRRYHERTGDKKHVSIRVINTTGFDYCMSCCIFNEFLEDLYTFCIKTWEKAKV